ncbi:M24 family metallopeptidase [Salinigranum sp. GCM10025319]|uniref:M24 family metallopeptidase n=1 Tax=Salinigranum sp. GCM10025319 TaxID=3252687 RepID=UPI00361A830E
MTSSDPAVDLAFDPERVRTSRLDRGLRAVRDALRERDAVAFVHAGDDADCAYFSSEAVVVTPDDAVGLVAGGARNVDAEFPPTDPHGESDGVALRTVDDPADAVARVADELTRTATGTVLAPRSIRHDTALLLERAGFDVASTAAVAGARAVKTPAERDALRWLGRATAAGVDAAVDRLSRATVDSEAGALRVDPERADGGTEDAEADSTTGNDGDESEYLTPERLRRAVAVELARRGVDAADTRVRGVDGRLVSGRPVLVDCRPRGPDGSRLRAAWTAVVDGDGGWERRAHVALRAAHRAGRTRLAAAADGEETAGGVESEVRAELTAYGFEESRVTVHGVGLSARERPLGGDPVHAGQVLVVAAHVTREADGTASVARRTDRVTRVETLLVGEEGVDRLVPLPASLSPGR